MYGHGSFPPPPQFRPRQHAPPPPPAPFQRVPPLAQPQPHHTPPPPPPSTYQHGPLLAPQVFRTPVAIPPPYLGPLPSGAPMVTPYSQALQQPLPPAPHLRAPPPSPSMGKNWYNTAPPLPPFIFSGQQQQHHLGGAQMTAAPPSPHLSSPPPPPPPPPPNFGPSPPSPLSGQVQSIEKETHLKVERTQAAENNGCKVEEGIDGDLPPPPPKPDDADLVKNIEVTCQFIMRLGNKFEEEVRMREVRNPKFSFLFGGDPGSAAAIGHEYFQWMKKKYKLEPTLRRDPACSSEARNLGRRRSPSPSDSDMDMEDDAINHDVVEVVHDVMRYPVRDNISIDSTNHLAKELLHATRDATRIEAQVCSSLSDPGIVMPKNAKGEGDSPPIEDINPGPVSSSFTQSDFDHAVVASSNSSPGASGLVNVSPLRATCRADQSGVSVRGGSPFRLIQGYASDESEDNAKLEDATNFQTTNASATDGSSLPIGSSQSHATPEKLAGFLGSSQTPDATSKIAGGPCSSICSAREDVYTGISQKEDGRGKSSVDFIKPSHSDDPLKSDNIKMSNELSTSKPAGDVKGDFNLPDVDEFGRLIKKDASDSDSGEVDYREKRGRRRRSRSRSGSPRGSRRKLRSPNPRRRGLRSRSWSWSPRRSRSGTPPASRRPFGFQRGYRDQPRECFNFIRGRCFHGSSCRFLHRDTGHTRSRQHRYRETLQDSRSYADKNVLLTGRSHRARSSKSNEVNDGKSGSTFLGEVKDPMKNVGDSDAEATPSSIAYGKQFDAEKETGHLHISGKGSGEPISQHQDDQELENIQEKVKVDPTKLHYVQPLPPQLADKLPEHKVALDETSSSYPLSELESPKPAKVITNDAGDAAHLSQRQGSLPLQTDEPTIQNPSQIHTSNLYFSHAPNSQHVVQADVPREPLPFSFPAQGPYQQPDVVHACVPHEASFLNHRSQPFNANTFSAHQPSMTNLSYPVPPSGPFWPSLPPSHCSGLPTPSLSVEGNNTVHIQQRGIPASATNGFSSQPPVRAYPSGEPSHHQGISYLAQPVQAVESSIHASFSEDLQQRHTTIRNWQGHPNNQEGFGLHLLPGAHLPDNSFSGDSFSSLQRELPSSYSQGQFMSQSPLAIGSIVESSLPRLPSSFSHYNPFASTFKQTTKGLMPDFSFSSAVGRGVTALPPNLNSPVGETLVNEVAFQDAPLGDSTAHSHADALETFPESSGVLKKKFTKDSVVGDAYDPICDSIEPSSDMLTRFDTGPTPEADELGEVALETEAGDVENVSPDLGHEKDWSQCGTVVMQSTEAGEIEVDQTQSPGKSKKSKESRSMKLLKIALADFVKEILKPSWRQGNMSKEAFKTIVKKTVDKVSGAVPSHQIPKSKAKIKRYVESSQRKVTKLVMGYVDKYVKM